MRKVKSNHITDSARLPFLKRTLDHLQDGNSEAMASIVNSLINQDNSTNFLVLWGCVPSYSTVSVSNDTLTITAGAILYNGEIFQVAGATVTVTGSNVHILTITETGQTGEPTTYTDSTTYTTNVVRTLVLGAGASGSGDVNWSNVKMLTETAEYSGTTFPNAIFDSISTPTGATLLNAQGNILKKGNVVTLSIELTFNIDNATAFNASASLVNIVLNSKYRKKPSTNSLSIPSYGTSGGFTPVFNSITYARADGSQFETNKYYVSGTVANGDDFKFAFHCTYYSV